MTQEAVVTEEGKKSKTQELRDWLDTEIKRCEDDVHVLSLSFRRMDNYPSYTRYRDLTSDERDAKVAQDRRKLEELQKRLELLRSARELDIDIDAMERAIPGLLIKVKNYSHDGLPLIEGATHANRGASLQFQIGLEDCTLGIFVEGHYPFDFVGFQKIETCDFPHDRFGYPVSYIKWHFPFQCITIGIHAPGIGLGTEAKLSISPISSVS